MRFYQVLLMSTVALLITSCGADHRNDYLQASEGPALKIPANVSTYAMQENFPVPPGASWHSDQPVSPYPPGSALAKTMEATQTDTTETVSIGVDDQGSAALNVNKAYQQVWQSLGDILQTLGYNVTHTDPAQGVFIATKANQTYRFHALQTEQGNAIISVRNTEGVALSEKDSRIIMNELQQQFRKIWS